MAAGSQTDAPWLGEPDSKEWAHAGLPCVALRHSSLGHWCGYVGLPAGHPMHGSDYDNVRRADGEWLEVHGGLTYARDYNPMGGAPDGRWWLGFDCAHAGDLVPFGSRRGSDVYRDLAYVVAETERLAEQLRAGLA